MATASGTSQWAAYIIVEVVASALLVISHFINIPLSENFSLGLLYLGVTIAVFIMTILFPLSLYFDASAIRQSSAVWNPNPHLYAALGLSHLVAFIDSRTLLFIVPLTVGLFYLYQRRSPLSRAQES